MKKIILSFAAVVCATSLFAGDFPEVKQSIGIVGGTSKSDLDDKSKAVYGISHKVERSFGDSRFYWGLGGDILYSDRGDANGVKDVSNLSIGVYPVLGIGIIKDLSASVMLGGAYDVAFYKDNTGDSNTEGKFGLLYGASLDYQLTESITTGVVYRHTEPKYDFGKVKNDNYMLRVAYSF